MKYEVTRQGTGEGARDAERDGGQQLSPLREAELPLRDRGGATCTDGSQLFAGEPNQVLDPSTGDGGTGSPSDAALSRGTRSPGGTRGGRPHRAGEQPFTSPKSEEPSPFSASEALYLRVVGFLSGEEAKGLTHSELEARLDVEGRELLRQLFQDHLDLRSICEVRAEEVRDVTNRCHRSVEQGHRRPLETIFGSVGVTRL